MQPDDVDARLRRGDRVRVPVVGRTLNEFHAVVLGVVAGWLARRASWRLVGAAAAVW